ncbi:hypothetical protein VOLCADRAFT_91585 [Volvox carteri f. nagariensis]|uniref:Uncharacterized protein n=1 Tax=Volvox carteri f. nagariensis TaxID=3068 RepID=D8TXG6_VOLCA|nr:uncharacterized protein VOLCADRAFT_91585 [Volvox carteri f. nagariensis]EFJ47907.1 hypothetical protein VOLCADRAFT_91585 [Volvox carteri f. nagariensis]|eukprot:XP_002951013.1 hypothetical protein VOLCADRAFT_91585 [Volvox carteri f. nagariensis]
MSQELAQLLVRSPGSPQEPGPLTSTNLAAALGVLARMVRGRRKGRSGGVTRSGTSTSGRSGSTTAAAAAAGGGGGDGAGGVSGAGSGKQRVQRLLRVRWQEGQQQQRNRLARDDDGEWDSDDPGLDLDLDLGYVKNEPGFVRHEEGYAGTGTAAAVEAEPTHVYGSPAELAAELAELVLTRHLGDLTAWEISNVTCALAILAPLILGTPRSVRQRRWRRRLQQPQQQLAEAAPFSSSLSPLPAGLPPSFSRSAAAAALQAACAAHWHCFSDQELTALLYGMVKLDPRSLYEDPVSSEDGADSFQSNFTSSTTTTTTNNNNNLTGCSETTTTTCASSWLATWFLVSERHVGSLGPRGLTVVLWALVQLRQRRQGCRRRRSRRTPLHAAASLSPPSPPASWAAQIRSRLFIQLPHIYPVALVQVAWGLARLQPWLIPLKGRAAPGTADSVTATAAVAAGQQAAPKPPLPHSPTDAEVDRAEVSELLALLTRAAIRKAPQLDSLRDLAQLSWAVCRLQESIWGLRATALASSRPVSKPAAPSSGGLVSASTAAIAVSAATAGSAGRRQCGGGSAENMTGTGTEAKAGGAVVGLVSGKSTEAGGETAAASLETGTFPKSATLLVPGQQQQEQELAEVEWNWDVDPTARWDDVARAEPQQQQQPLPISAKRAELVLLTARPARPTGYHTSPQEPPPLPQQQRQQQPPAGPTPIPVTIHAVLQPPQQQQQQQLSTPPWSCQTPSSPRSALFGSGSQIDGEIAMGLEGAEMSVGQGAEECGSSTNTSSSRCGGDGDGSSSSSCPLQQQQHQQQQHALHSPQDWRWHQNSQSLLLPLLREQQHQQLWSQVNSPETSRHPHHGDQHQQQPQAQAWPPPDNREQQQHHHRHQHQQQQHHLYQYPHQHHSPHRYDDPRQQQPPQHPVPGPRQSRPGGAGPGAVAAAPAPTASSPSWLPQMDRVAQLGRCVLQRWQQLSRDDLPAAAAVAAAAELCGLANVLQLVSTRRELRRLLGPLASLTLRRAATTTAITGARGGGGTPAARVAAHTAAVETSAVVRKRRRLSDEAGAVAARTLIALARARVRGVFGGSKEAASGEQRHLHQPMVVVVVIMLWKERRSIRKPEEKRQQEMIVARWSDTVETRPLAPRGPAGGGSLGCCRRWTYYPPVVRVTQLAPPRRRRYTSAVAFYDSSSSKWRGRGRDRAPQLIRRGSGVTLTSKPSLLPATPEPYIVRQSAEDPASGAPADRRLGLRDLAVLGWALGVMACDGGGEEKVEGEAEGGELVGRWAASLHALDSAPSAASCGTNSTNSSSTGSSSMAPSTRVATSSPGGGDVVDCKERGPGGPLLPTRAPDQEAKAARGGGGGGGGGEEDLGDIPVAVAGSELQQRQQQLQRQAASSGPGSAGGRFPRSAAFTEWCKAWSRSISVYDIVSAPVAELCAVLSAWAALRWRVDARTQALVLRRLVSELPALEAHRLAALSASLESLGWRLPPVWAEWLTECSEVDDRCHLFHTTTTTTTPGPESVNATSAVAAVAVAPTGARRRHGPVSAPQTLAS